MYGGGGDLVAQSYSTLCHPIACSLPGSSVHGILQARILEWVAISFSINYLGRGLIHMIFVKIYLNATFKAYLMENKINFYVFFIGYYYSFQLLYKANP